METWLPDNSCSEIPRDTLAGKKVFYWGLHKRQDRGWAELEFWMDINATRLRSFEIIP